MKMRLVLAVLCLVSTLLPWCSCERRREAVGPLGPAPAAAVRIRHVLHGHIRVITGDEEIEELVRAISDATYIDNAAFPYQAVREILTVYSDSAEESLAIIRYDAHADIYSSEGHFRSKAFYDLLTAAGGATSPRIERWLEEMPPGDVSGLLSLSEEARARVLKGLREEYLGWLAEGEAIPDIRPRLRAMLKVEKGAERKERLIEALGDLGDWEAAPLLIKILQSETEDTSVKAQAALVAPKLVGPHPNERLSPQLMSLLLDALGSESESSVLRRMAAFGLGELRGPAAIHPLGKVLLEADEIELRMAACCALGRFKGRQVESYLKQALNDGPEPVRNCARWNLSRVQQEP